MKIGLLFGSYNPIHIGHLLLATHVAEYAKMEEVWLVVSPLNPHKLPDDLIIDTHRLKMAELATQTHPFIKVCELEFKLSRPSYTHQTLKELKRLYPEHEFSLIIGADLLEKLNTWKEYEWIMDNFEVLVYNRSGYASSSGIKIIQLPLIDISATEIRKRIQEGKTIRYFVTPDVERYIFNHSLYK